MPYLIFHWKSRNIWSQKMFREMLSENPQIFKCWNDFFEETSWVWDMYLGLCRANVNQSVVRGEK